MEKHPNNCYIHNAVTNDITTLHRNTIEAAIVASRQHWVFIDRLHLSEKIYSTIFRNGPVYDITEFDSELNTIPNLYKILCHVDKDVALSKHSERKNIEMFNDVSKVWDMYNDIVKNDTTWKTYDWRHDVFDLDTLEITKGVK